MRNFDFVIGDDGSIVIYMKSSRIPVMTLKPGDSAALREVLQEFDLAGASLAVEGSRGTAGPT